MRSAGRAHELTHHLRWQVEASRQRDQPVVATLIELASDELAFAWRQATSSGSGMVRRTLAPDTEPETPQAARHRAIRTPDERGQRRRIHARVHTQ